MVSMVTRRWLLRTVDWNTILLHECASLCITHTARPSQTESIDRKVHFATTDLGGRARARIFAMQQRWS